VIEPNEEMIEAAAGAISDLYGDSAHCAAHHAKAALSAAIPLLTKRIANEIADRLAARVPLPSEIGTGHSERYWRGWCDACLVVRLECGEVVTDESMG